MWGCKENYYNTSIREKKKKNNLLFQAILLHLTILWIAVWNVDKEKIKLIKEVTETIQNSETRRYYIPHSIYEKDLFAN